MSKVQWIEMEADDFQGLQSSADYRRSGPTELRYMDRRVVKILVQLEDWEPGTYPVTKGEQALATLHRAKELCEGK